MYGTNPPQGALPSTARRCSWQTGTYKDRDFPESDRMWPRDFLPEKLPHARIVSFGYNADFAKFYPEDRENIAPELTIDDYSTSLLESVRALRKGEETVISPFQLSPFSPFPPFPFSSFFPLFYSSKHRESKPCHCDTEKTASTRCGDIQCGVVGCRIQSSPKLPNLQSRA